MHAFRVRSLISYFLDQFCVVKFHFYNINSGKTYYFVSYINSVKECKQNTCNIIFSHEKKIANKVKQEKIVCSVYVCV